MLITGRIKDDFIYLQIPKCGSVTFDRLLTDNGWGYVDLEDPNLNLSNYKLWGHLINPEHRYIKGINQFLKENPSANLEDRVFCKILLNGMYDVHTASITVLLKHLVNVPIHWIPLDLVFPSNLNPGPKRKMTGNELTNDFFKENGIDIVVTDSSMLNRAQPSDLMLRKKLRFLKESYKSTYHEDSISFKDTFNSFFSQDMDRYSQVVTSTIAKYTR